MPWGAKALRGVPGCVMCPWPLRFLARAAETGAPGGGHTSLACGGYLVSTSFPSSSMNPRKFLNQSKRQ